MPSRIKHRLSLLWQSRPVFVGRSQDAYQSHGGCASGHPGQVCARRPVAADRFDSHAGRLAHHPARGRGRKSSHQAAARAGHLCLRALIAKTYINWHFGNGNSGRSYIRHKSLIRRDKASAAAAATANRGGAVLVIDRVRTASGSPSWSLDPVRATLSGEVLEALHVETQSLYQYLDEQLHIHRAV